MPPRLSDDQVPVVPEDALPDVGHDAPVVRLELTCGHAEILPSSALRETRRGGVDPVERRSAAPSTIGATSAIPIDAPAGPVHAAPSATAHNPEVLPIFGVRRNVSRRMPVPAALWAYCRLWLRVQGGRPDSAPPFGVGPPIPPSPPNRDVAAIP